jgi:hypothetical protein
VIYCPIDFYGGAAEIEADGAMLRMCSRIIVHCERLRKYFEPYTTVEYMDHHVKFSSRNADRGRDDYILWVGVRNNLRPLVQWVNRHPLPYELHILTNLGSHGALPKPSDLGFLEAHRVRIQRWNRESHLELTAGAKGALDIKGDRFCQLHKPPTKAIDFLAAGVPLALNPGSSGAEHLARMGFEVASPLDTKRWFSWEYREETERFGRALRELLSLERIGFRYKRILECVVKGCGSPVSELPFG